MLALRSPTILCTGTILSIIYFVKPINILYVDYRVGFAAMMLFDSLRLVCNKILAVSTVYKDIRLDVFKKTSYFYQVIFRLMLYTIANFFLCF